MKKIQEKLFYHINEFHKESCECSNILNFLDSNLDAICEDIADWTKNDRESWLVVVRF